ncbi:unnamed protein product, partial [Nesidiocoris tenuis]
MDSLERPISTKALAICLNQPAITFCYRSGSKVLERTKASQSVDVPLMSSADGDQAENGRETAKLVLTPGSEYQELAEHMKNPNTGVGFLIPLPSLPKYAFVSVDAVHWIKNRVDGIKDESQAIKMLQMESPFQWAIWQVSKTNGWKSKLRGTSLAPRSLRFSQPNFQSTPLGSVQAIFSCSFHRTRANTRPLPASCRSSRRNSGRRLIRLRVRATNSSLDLLEHILSTTKLA